MRKHETVVAFLGQPYSAEEKEKNLEFYGDYNIGPFLIGTKKSQDKNMQRRSNTNFKPFAIRDIFLVVDLRSDLELDQSHALVMRPQKFLLP